MSWDAPFNGGRDISNYKIETYDNSILISTDYTIDLSSFKTVTDLSNGTLYNFKVYATNLAGDSVSSEVYATPFTVPSQITTVIAIPSDRQVDLSWDAPFNGGRDISNYKIETYDNSILISTDYTIDLSSFKTVTDLSNGTLYNFKVYATNLAGDSVSSEVYATPFTVPSQITTVIAIPSDRQVDLSWDAPTSNGRDISSYIIERSIDSTTWEIDSSTNASTLFKQVTGLVNGTLYYFRVYATNLGGNGSSSNVEVAIPNITPNAPTNLIATVGDRFVDLSWNEPTNDGTPILHYRIQISNDNSTWGFDISTNTTTFKQINDLSNGTPYYFRVYASNLAGESLASNASTPEVIPYTIPSAPTNLIATAGNGLVNLSWNAPASNGRDISSYIIEKSTDSSSWITDSSTNDSTLFKQVTDLSNGIKYYFRVYAINLAGNSPSSVIIYSTPMLVEYITSNILPPNQESYLITIDGIQNLFENTILVNDFLQNDIGVSQDYRLFNRPTLFITSVFNISSLNNLIDSVLIAYQKEIKTILIKRDVFGEEIISQGKIASVLEGNLKVYDLSENYIELKLEEADISDNVITVLSVIESTLNELQNKRYMKFYIKLIDLNSEQLITSDFNIPIIFNLTNTNVNTKTLIINRLNELTNQYEIIGYVQDISSKIFTFNLNSNSEYYLQEQQDVPDPPTNITAFQIGSGPTSKVYVFFVQPIFIGSTSIISYSVDVSAIGKPTKIITKSNLPNNIPIIIPFLTIGKEWTFKVKATNSNGSSMWSTTTTLIPTGSGTTTGDPIITTIYDEKYLLPNVNGNFLIFDNKKLEYPLYITADCFFLTSKELMNSIFISKWATNYTFMKTINIKFKKYNFTIDMNTLNINYNFKKNNDIIIGNIYEDKMILSRHYSINRKKELGDNLRFNGKSRKIDLIHENKVYTLRVSVDLGCADHRNEFVLDGPDLSTGYGAIISKNHKSKLVEYKKN